MINQSFRYCIVVGVGNISDRSLSIKCGKEIRITTRFCRVLWMKYRPHYILPAFYERYTYHGTFKQGFFFKKYVSRHIFAEFYGWNMYHGTFRRVLRKNTCMDLKGNYIAHWWHQWSHIIKLLDIIIKPQKPPRMYSMRIQTHHICR